MPPDGASQPSAEERNRLRTWVADYLDAEARAGAGDPGPVVLRRLNNAEYTYTIRDLTGVRSIRPGSSPPTAPRAKASPTPGGAGDVAGSADKYLDAAKEIAAHAVLLPDGIRFSPSTTRRRTGRTTWREIRADLREYTSGAGTAPSTCKACLSDTNDGGRLPLELPRRDPGQARDACGGRTTPSAARRHTAQLRST